jgi:hypothetical protein
MLRYIYSFVNKNYDIYRGRHIKIHLRQFVALCTRIFQKLGFWLVFYAIRCVQTEGLRDSMIGVFCGIKRCGLL